MADNPPCLLLCFHTGSTEQVQLALDYWAGSVRDGEWVWSEPVKEIAARNGLKNAPLLQVVRRAATAHDVSARCICQAKCDGGPRMVSCRSDAWPSSFEYVCDACSKFLRQQKEREEQERARVRVWKKRAFLASLVARATPFDYATIGYADAVAVYSMMLASERACESGRVEAEAFRLFPSEAMNRSQLMDLFQKGILEVCDDSPLDCIDVLDNGVFSYEVSRINWRFAGDARGLPYPEVFELVGAVIDQREAHAQFDEFVRDFWWRIAEDDALHFLATEARRFKFSEYRYGPKMHKAVRYALESYSIPQIRNLIRRSVGYAAQLSVARNYHGGPALAAVPALLISNVDRALSLNWTIYCVLPAWEQEPLLVRVFFDRVLRTGVQGFREMCGARLPMRTTPPTNLSNEDTQPVAG
jgi:hypothetical protein